MNWSCDLFIYLLLLLFILVICYHELNTSLQWLILSIIPRKLLLTNEISLMMRIILHWQYFGYHTAVIAFTATWNCFIPHYYPKYLCLIVMFTNHMATVKVYPLTWYFRRPMYLYHVLSKKTTECKRKVDNI